MKVFKFLGLLALTLFFTMTTLNAEVKSINIDELLKLKKNGIKIIDIRKPSDISKTGVIPTSYRLNFYKKDGSIHKEKWLKHFVGLVHKRDIKFVLISKEGKMAKKGAELLNTKKGYQNPLYLEGGINNWINNNYKTIKIK